MAEVLFGGLWKPSSKTSVQCPPKRVVGVLSWEVASLMSRLVNVWQCLEDRQIMRLREEMVNSNGIQAFISEDSDYLMHLALVEIMENVGYVARAVAVLGQRCTDPVYHQLKQVFDDPLEMDVNWSGWEYKLKKMRRKIKKMERFVAATTQLYHELEVVAELEQTLRRMQCNPSTNQVKLLEFQQKVFWERQEVKNFQEMSPWVRTYDYAVRLLLRSIFTIVGRVKRLIGTDQVGAVKENYYSEYSGGECLVRSNSIAALMDSSINLSENSLSGVQAGRFGRSLSSLGLAGEKKLINYKKLMKSKRFAAIGPFKGCMTVADSPLPQSFALVKSNTLRSDDRAYRGINHLSDSDIQRMSFSYINTTELFTFNFKHKLLSPPPSTLGYAALDLHYANIVILVEKLLSAPHLISLDARDDLYNMLPATIKTSLRAKLRIFSKSPASSVYDAALAADWRSALSRVLEWLSPLSHNMVKWYSERSFEKQRMTSGENVLLVQTLYFASKDKIEAAITELLMGLNYLSRFYKEVSEKHVLDSPCRRSCDVYLFHKDSVSHSMINQMS